MKRIYLDSAATTPVKKEVLKAMMPYFSREFGNASSIHWFGRCAKGAVEKSRKIVVEFLNCDPEEIIFTSGGTESDNLAIRGLIEQIMFCHHERSEACLPARQGSRDSSTMSQNDTKPHIITTAFEHHAVLDACKDLENKELAEVTYLKPDKQGLIHAEDVKKAIKKNTVLISVMYVNNEIGTVQPIAEIGKLVQSNNRIVFHTDAVQAAEYFTCDTKKLNVDMMSISAHKFGGPKGVGVLFAKKGIKLHRQNIGGAQENGLRGGTYNTPSIIGMAEAIKLLNSKFETRNSKIIKLRNKLIDGILKNIPDTKLNGDRIKRSPNNVNISFKYVEGEAILLHLDWAGIAASSGSACTSGSLDPSHVLLAIGLKHEDAHGSIRFTLGEETTKKEIDYVLKKLPSIIKKLRKMSPYGK